jgi:hypothetical protein
MGGSVEGPTKQTSDSILTARTIPNRSRKRRSEVRPDRKPSLGGLKERNR